MRTETSRMLAALLATGLLSGCAATSQTFEHFGQRVEHTHKANWAGESIDVFTVCDKTAVVGEEGRCPAQVAPVLKTSPGWATLTFQAVTAAAAYVPAAFVIRDGLRHQPTNPVSVANAATNSNEQTANPAITPQTTLNIRTGHWMPQH